MRIYFNFLAFFRYSISFILLSCLLLITQDITAQDLSQPQYDVIFEEDVEIQVRDGMKLRADIYRPDAPSHIKFPVLMNISAYQKSLDRILPHVPPFTHVERPEPEWWTARGYVLVFIDTRGTGTTPGIAKIWSMQESRDLYDAIEWSAVQDWSNGKVGLSGVSYYAITQWNVASLQPPSLTTIVPWEGWTDLYRDSIFQGGVFNQSFYGRWWLDTMGKQLLENQRSSNTNAFNDPLIWDFMVHHLDGPYWDEVRSRAQFDKIEVPLFSAGNWNGWTHHLRGNIEGYTRSVSNNKRLEVHIGGHVDDYYSDRGKHDMLRWYDYWLKDIDTGIMDEPPVKLCIRTSIDNCEWRLENEWPLARTNYTKYYLSADDANAVEDSIYDLRLSESPPTEMSTLTYAAGPEAYRRGLRDLPTISFVSDPVLEDIEVTGHIKVQMWVSSETDDMDIFAYLINMAPDGTSEIASRGILQVSHRKLDPELSTHYRPYHTHDEEQKLIPGDIVPIEVEIVATSMVFKEGHRIRLDINAHDGDHYFAAYNLENNSVYIGGDYPSYVQLPIIPSR